MIKNNCTWLFSQILLLLESKKLIVIVLMLK
jgi:hypothetical protein